MLTFFSGYKCCKCEKTHLAGFLGDSTVTFSVTMYEGTQSIYPWKTCKGKKGAEVSIGAPQRADGSLIHFFKAFWETREKVTIKRPQGTMICFISTAKSVFFELWILSACSVMFQTSKICIKHCFCVFVHIIKSLCFSFVFLWRIRASTTARRQKLWSSALKTNYLWFFTCFGTVALNSP